MLAPLYDEVHCLSICIVSASENDDHALEMESYEDLKNLCESNDGGDFDHPIQWEALGDFSESHDQALEAYIKGLACSEKLGLSEYTASIMFAMAESYFEQENITEASMLALKAKSEASKTSDNELRAAIDEFLAEVRGH